MPFIGSTTEYPVVTPAPADTVPLIQGGALQQSAAGSVAATGGLAGLRFTVDTDSTADSDPGAGLLKFNNATQASATELYVNDSTSDGVSAATFFAALPSGGWLLLTEAADRAKWRLFRYTALVDGTGYRKFTVASQAGAGSFSDAAGLLVAFMPGGDIAAAIHAASGKTTPVDADELGIADSAASYGLKKLTWANLKATLKTYFDTLYQPLAAKLTALASLTWASDKMPYFAGTSTVATTDLTAFARTILDDADAAAVRATIGAGTGGGDASTNTSTSVDGEVALFSGTSGKTLKRATGTGLAKLTGGVLSAATAGTDYYSPGGTDVTVADGGTGVSSLTAYAVMCGGTTSTGAVQSIASVGTSGQVLTSNGAGALPTFQNSSGGGLTNFTEAVNTSSPNATVPVVSLSATNAATDVDAAFKPKGAGAVTAHIADSTSTGGNKRGANAVDWQMVRGAANQVASGAQSVVAGGSGNRAGGQYSGVLAGLGNYAAGAYSSIGGGNGHTINHTYCFIGGGDSNTAGASAGYMGILCGELNAVSADYASITGGRLNQATALYAAVINGNTALATGQYSVAQGAIATADGTYSQAWGRRVHTKGRYGARAFGSGSVADSANRWNQMYEMVLRKRTSDATPTRLTSNDSAQSATNSPSVELSSAMTFQGTVTAVLGSGTNNQSKGWKFEGVIYRTSSGNATLISAVTPVVIAETGSATSWSIAVTADTTNQVLAVEATGVAATTIEWTCHIHCVETISG